MNTIASKFVGLLLAASVAAVPTARGAVRGVSDEKIRGAIERMQKFLFAQQGSEGDWEQRYTHGHAGGETALVTLALLTSGRPHQDPRVQEALRYLADKQIDSTYALSLRAHVWAALPDEYRPRLAKDAQKLQRAHRQAIFQYDLYPPGPGAVDHSCTQYGVLGLWEFAKRRGRTPQRFWDDALRHFIRNQNHDGGWSYRPSPGARSSGSMTAAGLTVLYVGLQERYRGLDRAPTAIMKSIDRGLEWLDRHYTPAGNPFGPAFHYYYLYCIERVALAGGVKQLNGLDWYASGAKWILGAEHGGSISEGHHADTAFALLFLSRGRFPVWINKLKVRGADWNNRPNDLYFLTQYLSDTGEQELNWQVADLDHDPVDYLNASIAWLSLDSDFELTEAQKANLKGYLDLGGLLVVNPDMNSARMSSSLRVLAQDLYPDYPLRPLAEDHPLVAARAPASLQAVHNGARDLILMLPDDWGRRFQRDDVRRAGTAHPGWATMEALVSLVYENRRAGHRLMHPFDQRRGREVTGVVSIGRARYDGNWNCEPRSWEPVKTHLFNATGKQLQVRAVPLDQIDTADVALVHLSGVEAVTLGPPELAAIRRFVDGGGTVLVETVGGHGDFSVAVMKQLSADLGQVSVSLDDSPIISGEGIEGFDNRRVIYRAHSVIQFGLRSSPALAVFMVNERPAIIVSHEDLSLGALGLRHRHVNGYRPMSARNLLSNVVLYAGAARAP